jgi:GSH-dependent disulfide-bond oxidoreductase
MALLVIGLATMAKYRTDPVIPPRRDVENPMIKFYYHPSPNPAKVALFLEEAGLEYEVVPVDTRKGEQHLPAFLAINPNAKTPALTDGDATLFDSTAILLYLSQKTGKFGAPAGAEAQFLSWLMLVATGIGPYSGQAVHFKHHAPERIGYATNRYMVEAERHWGLIDAQLGKGRYMLGETYTIVDMAVWGWARAVPYIFGEAAWEGRANLKRLVDEISARPAAERVNAMAARHSFKQEMDDEAKAAMFPQNKRLAVA